MKPTIPLDEMTTAEKLQAIEEIWAELQRLPEELPSPGWHADVLAARERGVQEGTSRLSDWGTAEEAARLPVTESQRRLLDERIDEQEANPDDVEPSEPARGDILRKL